MIRLIRFMDTGDNQFPYKYFNAFCGGVPATNTKVLFETQSGISIGAKPDVAAMTTTFQNQINLQNNGILINECNDFLPSLKKYSTGIFQAIKNITKPLGKFIAIWQVVRLTKENAELYKDPEIDLIFIECYWRFKWQPLLWLIFKIAYNHAKKAGILNKLVISLGTNQDKPNFNILQPANWQGMMPWCNDEKTLRAQLDYLKKKCKGIAGVGMYVYNKITQPWFNTIDSVFNEYFPN